MGFLRAAISAVHTERPGKLALIFLLIKPVAERFCASACEDYFFWVCFCEKQRVIFSENSHVVIYLICKPFIKLFRKKANLFIRPFLELNHFEIIILKNDQRK